MKRQFVASGCPRKVIINVPEREKKKEKEKGSNTSKCELVQCRERKVKCLISYIV